MELSNSIRRTVSSLNETKYRKEFGLFKAEGTKCALDIAKGFETEMIIATPSWVAEHPERASVFGDKLILAKNKDMERMSSLSTAPPVIAVCRKPTLTLNPDSLEGTISIALDCIQDPGNLGTIIRTADWFGIRNILCSTDTVDSFNPKVVQATMGALTRVKVYYCDLAETIKNLPENMPVYGTFLEGDDIYNQKLSSEGIIVMGNEGRGISEKIKALITSKLFIPSFPAGQPTSESLNVSVATAIVVSEFRRRSTM